MAVLSLVAAAAIAGLNPKENGLGGLARVAISRSLTAAQMLALADAARTHGDPELEEKIYRSMLVDPSTEVRSEARFRLAMIENGRGHLKEAALLLRRVLDDHPDAGRARLEMVGILAKLGDEDAA